CQQESIWPTF
nr:immunoglobulin light chain junction region [Macaca mulatta]MPN91857.1 immunoglobulin light chain junction region [Macaca mulatta]MPN92316.1 immunoglobulin light chain junction region [Macaca mulatta]MPN92911.1 immunoglobulin light chain junction region [Macaca mulatta]MPN93360.1 immunoglobulin light chain junction region [Macaca mulatta]